MKDFKSKIQKIASDKPSKWREKAASRIKSPWLWLYSSQIASRVLAAMDDNVELSQNKLADMIGVMPQDIKRIIKGHENLTLETIYKLSKALNVELISFPVYKYSAPIIKADSKPTDFLR